mmetsp:Transcript_33671/g.66696  ORF Transcript_33671/g.66696 Transcript_33671/m.66696 type:complete len:89 (+) Transcript_33671:20-286(+)
MVRKLAVYVVSTGRGTTEKTGCNSGFQILHYFQAPIHAERSTKWYVNQLQTPSMNTNACSYLLEKFNETKSQPTSICKRKQTDGQQVD